MDDFDVQRELGRGSYGVVFSQGAAAHLDVRRALGLHRPLVERIVESVIGHCAEGGIWQRERREELSR